MYSVKWKFNIIRNFILTECFTYDLHWQSEFLDLFNMLCLIVHPLNISWRIFFGKWRFLIKELKHFNLQIEKKITSINNTTSACGMSEFEDVSNETLTLSKSNKECVILL